MSALRSTNPSPTSEDAALVAAVRRGDDGAFGELYSRYGRRITSYVFGMVGDHGRAEDITQEVFISALRQMRKTERPISFKPWIYEIARNACIDEFRRARRAHEVPLAGDDDSEGAERRLVSLSPTPDAALENRQQLDDLRGAFRGLSENHHKLIVLREFEGLSYTEIGERMGMTRPVVESTLFRARRRLNDEYQEIASGRRCEQVQSVLTGGDKSVHSLGIRERRRLVRHVSHCQPCRRHARIAGVDESVLKTPGLGSKIAALLPIPAFLRFRRPTGQDEAGAVTGQHSVAVLQSAQTVAQYVDPSSPLVGFGRVAAAAAAIAVAGGSVVGVSSQLGGTSSPHKPAAIVHSSSGSTRSAAAGTGSPTAKTASSRAASAPAGAGSAQSNPGSGTSGNATVGKGSQNSNATTGESTGSAAYSTSDTSDTDSSTPSTGSSNPTSTSDQPTAGLKLPTLPAQSTAPTLPSVNLSPLPGILKVALPALPQITSGLPQVNLPGIAGQVTKPGALVGSVAGGLKGHSG